MPHTGRRKKKAVPNKRIEITDENGWTRVTRTNQNQRAPKPVNSSLSSIPVNAQKTVPEPGASVEKIKLAYDALEQQWLASESCKALVKVLKEQVLANGFHVDSCIIFGSASFCGVSQGGNERIDIALIQLAVLKTMQSTIGFVTKQPAMAFAQDPAYNEVDGDFLRSLDVTETKHPDGFGVITQKSLVYTPNTEMFVEMEVLRKKPVVLLTGKLDWYWRNEQSKACTNRVGVVDGVAGASDEEVHGQAFVRPQKDYTSENARLEEECQIFEAFLAGKQNLALPRMDYRDEPFYNQYLYWPSNTGSEEDASLDGKAE